MSLKPWAWGPFDLLLHAELHLQKGEDFDRRIALISFDNAIEVAITTYLNLHPIQRQNRTYSRVEVEKWRSNYHTKIDFFMDEIQKRALPCLCERSHIIWYHDVRNGQYHSGGATIPQERELQQLRRAALWIFSVLYDIADVEQLLESHVLQQTNQNLPVRKKESDLVIDGEHGVCQIAGDEYYTSEALYAIDPVAYSEEAARLNTLRNHEDNKER